MMKPGIRMSGFFAAGSPRRAGTIVTCLGVVTAAISFALVPVDAAAQNTRAIDASAARVIDYWTSERRARAIPRDLVIDPRGLGYLRRPDGSLVPYGHEIAADASQARQLPTPLGKPTGGGSVDTEGPVVSNMNPAANATIGASHTFSATVIDNLSGVKSVTFKIQKGSSAVQSFSASSSDGVAWSVPLQGFTDGDDWTWWVEAKDGAPKGGNTGASKVVAFTVSTGGSGGGGSGDTVTNARWTAGSAVKKAAGRVFFEMPGNSKRKTWWGYVCSGTVVDDQGASGRSLILTAAHCVYDDVNKAFARNVMFIPDQDGTTGSGTDRNCGNDPIGCWVPSFGVVDVNWTTRRFPANVEWDYGFYVVSDSGAHSGPTQTSQALDVVAGFLPVNFDTPVVNDNSPGKTSPDFTHALGYSYSEDPNFMYCAEDMTTEGSVNWWLPSCALSGGSSGGPWVQPMITTTGSGDIISVNSWGYTSSPGMAGPKLVGTSAACIFGNTTDSQSTPFFNTSTPPPDGDAGYIKTCP